jgi:acetyltransferase-like isoleucine patch superfamily enzyme
MNESRNRRLVARVRQRAASTLSSAPSRVLGALARAALLVEDKPSVKSAWEAARTQQLLSSLSCHGERIAIQHPITVAGASAVSIGNDVSFAAYVHIWGQGGVTIGDRVMIGTHTSITSLTHDYTQETMRSTVVRRPVTVGDDVWIGSNCVIMPGVSLGSGSVVGAGSVVTKDVLAFSIVSGVPARVTGNRPREQFGVADD